MSDQVVVPAWWHSPELDKLDRRTRKTREALYVAMAELLSEKRLQDISVTELARRADVNRSTFYMHFQDIYSMVECMQRDFTDTVKAVLRERGEELATGSVRPTFETLYSYFRDHRKMFDLVFGAKGVDSFYGDVATVISETLLEVLPLDCSLPEQTALYIMDFVARGSIGLAKAWVERGCVEDVDAMVELNTALVDSVRTGMHDAERWDTGARGNCPIFR